MGHPQPQQIDSTYADCRTWPEDYALVGQLPSVLLPEVALDWERVLQDIP